MSRPPFSNVHAHVFNSECVPDNFLRVLAIPLVRKYPNKIKRMLDSKSADSALKFYRWLMSNRSTNRRSNFDKMISFLSVAQKRSQLEVFELAYDAGRQYDSCVRIVGLTMNMDFMDNKPSDRQISFVAQLEGVKNIKRYYPANFFPFLGIDPRHKSGKDLVHWAKDYFSTGVEHKGTVYPFFSGIKFYPALGFFPFDPKLTEFYEYAQENELPIITHTTRVGSQYIGNRIQDLIPNPSITVLPMIMPASPGERAIRAKTAIEQRIKAYYDQKWITNNDRGDNDFACDLFSHPDNYIPLLERFPRLKLCLAHMGGSNEICAGPDVSEERSLEQIRQVDNRSWFERIKEMMIQYPNLYTDISYTIVDLDREVLLHNLCAFLETTDIKGIPLYKRVLFGTDFFMAEKEKTETVLYRLAQEKLGPYFEDITRNNPQEFLKQPM